MVKKTDTGKKPSKALPATPKKKITNYRDTVPDASLEQIIASYERLVYVQARKHVRERVELEDLMAEGRQGIIEAYRLFTDPELIDKVPEYTFHQAVMYRITRIFYYCLNNASPLKTPIYIQRGCMHVGQIFKILNNQNAAEDVLGKKGQATDWDIIQFIYDEVDRLPCENEIGKKGTKYTLKEVKSMIIKPEEDPYFKQILDGVLHHRNGNRHTFVKNNLTDRGKVLHIKNKLYFCAKQNKMKYSRLIDLILSARVLLHELDSGLQKPSDSDLDKELTRKQVLVRGKELLGEKNFNIFIDSTINNFTYSKIADKYQLKKSKVSDVVNECLSTMRHDPLLQQLYKDLL